MEKEIVRERPFEYLKRKETKEAFTEDTVRNWYVARAYVLDRLKDVFFEPGSEGHLNAVVDGDSPLMLAVVRQIALSAHYINFVEYDSLGRLVCANRTVVTIVTQKDASAIMEELEWEENLGNLLMIARYSLFGTVKNEDSYIDVVFEIVRQRPAAEDCVLITEEDIEAFAASVAPEEIFTIDTRKAVCASRVYTLGGVIDDLPYEDIDSPGRYDLVLDVFRCKVLEDKHNPRLVTSRWNRLPVARRGISNIISADCFASREAAVRQQYPAGRKLSEKERNAIWEENNPAMSLSEHGRWVVEKLIMGFRPFNPGERLEYESLSGKKRAAYVRERKEDASDPAHIDICSYRDLFRIDPESLKYDSLLMLAIPLILDKVR